MMQLSTSRLASNLCTSRTRNLLVTSCRSWRCSLSTQVPNKNKTVANETKVAQAKPFTTTTKTAPPVVAPASDTNSKSKAIKETETAPATPTAISAAKKDLVAASLHVDEWFRWTNGSSVINLFSVLPKDRIEKVDRKKGIYNARRAYRPPPPKSKEEEPPNFLRRLYLKRSLKGTVHRMNVGLRMFQAVRRQSNDPRWYGPGRIGRDFQSRHAMLSMHFWFLHHRLSTESPHYKHAIDAKGSALLCAELTDNYWNDGTSRLRDFGVNEFTMNKHLKLMQKVSFAHFAHYDMCFGKLEGAMRTAELKIAVRRHILGETWKPDPRHNNKDGTVCIFNDVVDRLVAYIEAQYDNIAVRMPDSFFHEGNILWVDLPDFTNMRDNDGNLLQTLPLHPDDVLPIPWEQLWTLEGKKYYWNLQSHRTTYDHPSGKKESTFRNKLNKK